MFHGTIITFIYFLETKTVHVTKLTNATSQQNVKENFLFSRKQEYKIKDNTQIEYFSSISINNGQEQM